MFGDNFSSSTSCSRWLHETEPGRLDQPPSCCFLKVATHPLKATCDLVLCFGCSCWPKFTTLEFAKDYFKSFIKIVIGFARRPIRVKVYYQRTGFVRRHSEVRHELFTDLFASSFVDFLSVREVCF